MTTSGLLILTVGAAMVWSLFLFRRSTEPSSAFYIDSAEDVVSGTIWAGIGLVLYIFHYADHWRTMESLRERLNPLRSIANPDSRYRSSLALSVAVILLYIPRMLVYTRVAKRASLRRLNSLLAPYLALVTVSVCLWFIIRAMYHLGALGDVILGVALGATIVLGLVRAAGALAGLCIEFVRATWLHLKRWAVPIWKRFVGALVAVARFRSDVSQRIDRATASRRRSNTGLQRRLDEKVRAAEEEIARNNIPK